MRATAKPIVVAVLTLAGAGCLGEGPEAIAIARAALIPDGVERLAVTVIRPSDREMECLPSGAVRVVGTDVIAGSTAALFADELASGADLVGPVELVRGRAEGAVIDGIRPGMALVFVEGFDPSDQAVARACGGPVLVVEGGTTDVDLTFSAM